MPAKAHGKLSARATGEASTSKQQNIMLTAALLYASRGIPVFPCKRRDKAPLT
jgi:hypothetical protein